MRSNVLGIIINYARSTLWRTITNKSLWAYSFSLSNEEAHIGKHLDFVVLVDCGRHHRRSSALRFRIRQANYPKCRIPSNIRNSCKNREQHFCAYELRISNSSRRKVEDVTFHVRSHNENLKLDVTSKPEGLEYNLIDEKGDIGIYFPRIKKGETVVVKAQVENRYYFSDSLGVTVSSPNDIKEKRISDTKQTSPPLFRTPIVFALGVAFATAMIYVVAFINANRPRTEPVVYEMDRRDVVISAASTVGLPHFAELYLNASDPKYFNEGDIAYSLAVASGKPDEIEKYRRLLSVTLGTGPGIAPESQANLFYSLGRLDLLLSDENRAISDFRNAITKSRAIVETQAKADMKIHKFLIEKGLL